MPRTMTVVRAIVAVGLFVVTAPVAAHHAFSAAFDENKPINLQGTVTKVELVNPHSWIWIDVKGKDGKVVNWGIEGGPPSNLFRNGITKASLPIGTEIKLFGYQAKSGESKGVGVFVEYLDGKKVFMGGSAPGANGASKATAVP
ncbi:MAG TPA: DUF6152 family protein [Vicinamibacterales bacterium]|nr:DUF6152 family protein [Vicinamibacterales bacterium]